VQPVAVPVGLVLLVGPPAAGKSSFARELVRLGRIDPAGVVSADAIRAEIFGPVVRLADDPAVFNEVDARIAARLAAGLPVLVDATNVTPAARARARKHGGPATALRFPADDEVLLTRNAARTGHRAVPTDLLLHLAATFRAAASVEQLRAESFDVVADVHGKDAAEYLSFVNG
jgi:predicted kinase